MDHKKLKKYGMKQESNWDKRRKMRSKTDKAGRDPAEALGAGNGQNMKNGEWKVGREEEGAEEGADCEEKIGREEGSRTPEAP